MNLLFLPILATAHIAIPAPSASVVEIGSPEWCYLIPPTDWEIASVPPSSENIRVAFVKKTKSSFRPSLNLTTEPVRTSVEEYLKAVEKLHTADRQTEWRHLGQIHTLHGPAEVTQLDVNAEWGNVRMLQFILIRHQTAYIVTAASLKREFSAHYRDFYSVFQNIQFTCDLTQDLIDSEQKEALKEAQNALESAWKKALASSDSKDPIRLFESSRFQKKHWAPFQKIIEKRYGAMGAHWQFLMIKTTQEQLLRSVQ